MRVLMISSEATPIAKSGGLADVLSALSAELCVEGDEVLIALPRYAWISLSEADESLSKPIFDCSFRVKTGMADISYKAYRAKLKEVPIVLLDSELFAHYDKLYGDEHGDYSDNALRFASFTAAALRYVEHKDWKPDAVHAHDWQSALAPYYMEQSSFFSQTKSVITIHNLGYQGIFSRYDSLYTGIDTELLLRKGAINYLAAGLAKADAITTVSPTYAQEICYPEQGFGLNELLSSRKTELTGILNGIDYHEWNPAKDKHLSAQYAKDDLSGKAQIKAEIQARYGLEVNPDIPLFVSISRLADQKGFAQLLKSECFEAIAHKKIQYIILGTGSKAYEDAIKNYAARYPNIVGLICFDMKLSHELEAAADFFVMPSVYEPCGLNQIFSLCYGTLPIVNKTGGLADTVVGLDAQDATGIVIDGLSDEKLIGAFETAAALYKDQARYRAIQQRAMSSRFDWKKAAALYRTIYRSKNK